MTFSIRAIIRAFAAPEHRLACEETMWRNGLAELSRRGAGERESGAFLLGVEYDAWGARRREIRRFVFYDDLDPQCLDSGIVVFDGLGYAPLWTLCRKTRLQVVADVHTHPGIARQSEADRCNPMIAIRGHFAIIVPNFARRDVDPGDLGIYEYLGSHEWTDFSGSGAGRIFYTGFWS
jgi:hypothetical protein